MMDVIILRDNKIKGRYGKYSAIDPVPLPDGTFMIPARCLQDKDLKEAVEKIMVATTRKTELYQLSDVKVVEAGKIYQKVDEKEQGTLIVADKTYTIEEADLKTPIK